MKATIFCFSFAALACLVTGSITSTGLTSQKWIETGNFSYLEGIFIPAGVEEYTASLEIVANVLARSGKFDEPRKLSFFSELKSFYERDYVEFKKFIEAHAYGIIGDLAQDFVRFAILKRDFELLEFLVHETEAKIELEGESLEILSNHLRSHSESFFRLFPGLLEVTHWEFLLEFGLNRAQLGSVFRGRPEQAIRAIWTLCTETASSYLLRAGIKHQVLSIYSTLSKAEQTDLQLPLFYRSLLTPAELEVLLDPNSERDFSALLLGPKRYSCLFKLRGNLLLKLVYRLAYVDESILDWFIMNFDRSFVANARLLPAKESEMVEASAGSSNPVQLTSAEFALIANRIAASYILKHRKIAAYACYGPPDFLLFLRTAPVEVFPYFEDILAEEGTAEELLVFFERAGDEQVTRFYEKFWENHDNEEQFVPCATLLLNRVSPITTPMKAVRLEHFQAKKLLQNFDVLFRLHAMNIKIYFDFSSITEFVVDDVFFERMLQIKQVFIESAMESDFVDLNVFPEQLDRLMLILNMSAHQLLELFWSTHRKYSENIVIDHVYCVLASLKRWNHDNPDLVSSINESDPRQLSELVQDQTILTTFDESFRQIIKAFILLR